MKSLLISAALSFLATLAVYSESAEIGPEELTKLYYDHHSTHSYEDLAEHVHPYTLEQFKKITSRILNALAEEKSEESVVQAFEGISALDELKQLTDRNYWIYIMGTISSYSETHEWTGEIEYISSVSEGDFLYVLHRTRTDLETTSEDERLRSPRSLTLMKDRDQWKIYSFHVQSVERYLKWHLHYFKNAEPDS
ncbi:MAG: hypothetical protein ACSHYA_19525 [Opitutaceae bacterium]